MKSFSIHLPEEMAEQLQALSDRQQRSPEETVVEIVRKRLILDRFHELCRESESLARAAGFDGEDDLLRAVS